MHEGLPRLRGFGQRGRIAGRGVDLPTKIIERHAAGQLGRRGFRILHAALRGIGQIGADALVAV